MLEFDTKQASNLLEFIFFDKSKNLIEKISLKYKIEIEELNDLFLKNSRVIISEYKDFKHIRPPVFPVNEIKAVLDNDIQEKSQKKKIDENKCMARVIKNGVSCQCTRKKKDTFDYCGIHINKQPFKRIDEIFTDESKKIIHKKNVNLDKIEFREVKEVVDSISDIELEIDSIDSEFEEENFNINIDETKIDKNIDDEEDINVECILQNFDGIDYFWNNQTNELFDKKGKLVGKVLGNGKIDLY